MRDVSQLCAEINARTVAAHDLTTGFLVIEVCGEYHRHLIDDYGFRQAVRDARPVDELTQVVWFAEWAAGRWGNNSAAERIWLFDRILEEIRK